MFSNYYPYSEEGVGAAIRRIIKRNRNLKSLSPPKRPLILKQLKRMGYNISLMDLTRIINTFFKQRNHYSI